RWPSACSSSGCRWRDDRRGTRLNRRIRPALAPQQKLLLRRSTPGRSPSSRSRAATPGLFASVLVVDVQLGELLPKRGDLGLVVDDDVGLQRMREEVVLVVSLSVVELLQWRELSDDLAPEHVRGLELIDVGARDAALRVVHVENRRSVLTADVGPLLI